MQNNALTVKWVLPDGGATWFPTDCVAAIPMDSPNGCSLGVMGLIDRVEFNKGDDGGVRASIDRGVVYILNAAGKTIDTITLGLRDPS
jgi:hypothetical protein